jgi:putative membrane protein
MGWGYGPQWGMMGGGWGGYGWGGPFHVFFGVIVLVLIVLLVVWLFRSGSRGGERGGRLERRSSGLDVLEERYARGEINRDEYLQKKRDIAG